MRRSSKTISRPPPVVMSTAHPATVGHLTQAGERSWKLLLMRMITGLNNASDRQASGSFPTSAGSRRGHAASSVPERVFRPLQRQNQEPTWLCTAALLETRLSKNSDTRTENHFSVAGTSVSFLNQICFQGCQELQQLKRQVFKMVFFLAIG